LAEYKPAVRTDNRATHVLEKAICLDKLPKAKFLLKETENFSKRAKLEVPELKKELFDLFADNGEMTLDEINSYVEQPRVIFFFFKKLMVLAIFDYGFGGYL
jgi:hypothetical protein